MEENLNILLLPFRKTSENRLIAKCTENILAVFGKSFTLEDILSLDCFTEEEREQLKKIFGGEFSFISADKCGFRHVNGKWRYENTDQTHEMAMKILNKMRGVKIGSTVDLSEYELVKEILRTKDEIIKNRLRESKIHVEEDLYNDAEDQKMVEFITRQLKQKFEQPPVLSYEFMLSFFRAYQEYDDMVVERCLAEMKQST